MKKYFSVIPAVLALAFAGSTVAQAEITDPSAAPGVRMLTLNSCGITCAYPTLSTTNANSAAGDWATNTAHAMDNWDADAVMLTEVCYGQYAALKTRMASPRTGSYTDNDTYDAEWYTPGGRESAGCGRWGTDHRFGLAVLVKGGSDAITERLTKYLTLDPADSNQNNHRGILCAKAKIDGKNAMTCVTHPSQVSVAGRTKQIQEALAAVQSWAGTTPVILGGDFNAQPLDQEMGLLYSSAHPGGTGQFSEVDETDQRYFAASCAGKSICRSGEDTFGSTAANSKKIDYIFATTAHFKDFYGDAAQRDIVNWSDHSLLRGAAAWR